MLVVERRFDVKLISSAALAQYMKHRDMTVRELAAKVGCSHSTIGHLRTGERTYIRSEWAKAIEKALDAPRGSLFVVELSTVTRETSRKRKQAA